jgi:CRP-like cAMP-binding protein
MLQRGSQTFGLTTRCVIELVQAARILVTSGARPIVYSGDRDGLVNFVVHGLVIVQLVQPDRRASVLNIVRPGEFFCLPPSPQDASYHVRGVAFDQGPGADGAVVALWKHETLMQLIAALPPSGVIQLLTMTWLALARRDEESRLLLDLDVGGRLAVCLHRLARRFGKPHRDGILIDLQLTDAFLAQLISAGRETVNRRLQTLMRDNVIRREPLHRLLLLRPTPVTAESWMPSAVAAKQVSESAMT